MSKLIFGCGYLGRRVAKLWQDSGETVHVVTRSANRAAELQGDGYQALVADVTQPETLVDLPKVNTVLFAVGFDRSIGYSIAEVYAGGVKHVLAALPDSVQQFIYISTTGVYGPADGAWVDEATAPNPQREGGKASLAAEHWVYKNGLGGKALVLRMAGIYGPERIPYRALLRAAEPIAAPSEGWLNLIHVDDGAKIVLTAEAWAKSQAAGPHVFCASDGCPVVRSEYYCEVARQLGAQPPTFIAPEPNSPAAARARADRRISNRKLFDTLRVELAYPSYREGLAAILGKGDSEEQKANSR